MRDRWLKIKKNTPQSESTMKTPTSTKKRFQFNAIVNQVLKLFASSNQTQTQTQAEPQKTQKPPHHFFDLPSISVTSPEGQTTVVE